MILATTCFRLRRCPWTCWPVPPGFAPSPPQPAEPQRQPPPRNPSGSARQHLAPGPPHSPARLLPNGSYQVTLAVSARCPGEIRSASQARASGNFQTYKGFMQRRRPPPRHPTKREGAGYRPTPSHVTRMPTASSSLPPNGAPTPLGALARRPSREPHRTRQVRA
jgi:hypothetical protein